VNGERAEHVCAFLRRHGSDAVVVVAGRWYTRLGGEGEDLPLGESAWGNTGIDLPAGPWSRAANTFTGESYEIGGSPERRGFALAELLARFPVALLQMH
jgi:(1->4)-alpha-D-glucan 1-alpha-D-glucosylmutase